jgi:site-specific recombinase XerD
VNPSREAVEGREQTLTFAQVADRYERDFVASELAATTAQEYRRLLRKEVLPNLGRLPANSIGRQDVVLLLDRIKKRGPVLANRVQALISGVFRFAIEQELAKENPCVGIRRRTKERKTGRALSMHDLGRIWRALETESVLMRSIFRFILLTGQRGRTVTRFAREQIRQTEHGLVWEVPPEITKKDRPHVLPLLPVALEQVEALDGVSALVFPSPRGAGALSLKALAHAAARIRRRGKVPLRVKDLRTTVATRLGEFGTTRHIRRLILAHKDPSILAHYDLYSYLPQMRDALATWEARVTEAVAEKS